MPEIQIMTTIIAKTKFFKLFPNVTCPMNFLNGYVFTTCTCIRDISKKNLIQ